MATLYLRQSYSVIDLLRDAGAVIVCTYFIVWVVLRAHQIVNSKMRQVHQAFRILTSESNDVKHFTPDQKHKFESRQFKPAKSFALVSSMPRACCKGKILFRHYETDEKYYDRGNKKIRKSVDLVELLRT